MGFFDSMNISASGMTAQRANMDAISMNLANVNSVGPDGKAYKRKVAVMDYEESPKFVVQCGGVMGDKGSDSCGKLKVAGIVDDNSSVIKVFDPTDPRADKNGMVEKSNVNVITEMTSMIAASRAYEANSTSIQTAKKMMNDALGIGKQ
jgi:flagellar basal-body rod protein FlgC